MKSEELMRSSLINMGQRGLSTEIPTAVIACKSSLRVWNVLEQNCRDLIRIGTEGTREEVIQAYSCG